MVVLLHMFGRETNNADGNFSRRKGENHALTGNDLPMLPCRTAR